MATFSQHHLNLYLFYLLIKILLTTKKIQILPDGVMSNQLIGLLKIANNTYFDNINEIFLLKSEKLHPLLKTLIQVNRDIPKYP